MDNGYRNQQRQKDKACISIVVDGCAVLIGVLIASAFFAWLFHSHFIGTLGLVCLVMAFYHMVGLRFTKSPPK